ncbi:MAG: FHA domain-containing protein [Actinomycetota bacterium]
MLQIGLLLLLYLFIWRIVRAVGSGMSDRATKPAPAVPAAPSPAAAKPRRRKAAGPPSSVIVRTQQGKKASTHKLDGDDVEIGRAAGCAITLDDTYASQSHARLSYRDGAWAIQDLGSTNGTFLNERRLEGTSEVRAGDRIRIGTTILELRA